MPQKRKYENFIAFNLIPKKLQNLVSELRESSWGLEIVNGLILVNMDPFTISQPRDFCPLRNQILKFLRYNSFSVLFFLLFLFSSISSSTFAQSTENTQSNPSEASSQKSIQTSVEQKKKEGEQKLKKIHSKLHLLHGSLSEEYPEQLMAATYLPEDAVVLELGGNVGRNSCVIASILNDSSHFVVAESSQEIAKQLQENRDHNGLHFHIEASAISKVPLIQNHWNTIPSETDVPGYFRVNTISFEELEKKYHLTFNTLVVDCEGALYYMLKDDPAILKNIRLVIIENDYLDPAQYQAVKSLFELNELKLIYTESLPYGPAHLPCKGYFFQVWSK